MSIPVNQRKPPVIEAMKILLHDIKENIIDRMDYGSMCVDDCYGCPKKIIEFLIFNIELWEERVNHNYPILLGDVNKLAKIAKKSQAALRKNGLL